MAAINQIFLPAIRFSNYWSYTLKIRIVTWTYPDHGSRIFKIYRRIVGVATMALMILAECFANGFMISLVSVAIALMIGIFHAASLQ